jgi:hypothetical protein
MSYEPDTPTDHYPVEPEGLRVGDQIEQQQVEIDEYEDAYMQIQTTKPLNAGARLLVLL